ncbi:rhomboid-related protein 4-like [Leuresthes tenuis]|uniref:rhomboid-related protein 4-like n=1 Tax=Leuresthes tenuis TaxID=355514 RepID=UPI003B5153FE
MQRGFHVGLPLLLIQLFQSGFGNISPITMAVFGFNVYLYVFPAASPMKACVSLQQVYRFKEWHRLLLSPLHHYDDLHLYVNMVSFLWKGNMLERRLGGGWFLYLLSVFSLLTGLVFLLIQMLMTKLMECSGRLVEFIDLSSLSSECVIGFSGVLFALKVVSNHFNPGDVTHMLNIRVSNRFASWVELMLIYLIVPWSSLVGHLAGILVGLMYTLGPLKIIMKTCAELVSSGGNHPCNSSSGIALIEERENDKLTGHMINNATIQHKTLSTVTNTCICTSYSVCISDLFQKALFSGICCKLNLLTLVCLQ